MRFVKKVALLEEEKTSHSSQQLAALSRNSGLEKQEEINCLRRLKDIFMNVSEFGFFKDDTSQANNLFASIFSNQVSNLC
jgi:hypothetical protein